MIIVKKLFLVLLLFCFPTLSLAATQYCDMQFEENHTDTLGGCTPSNSGYGSFVSGHDGYAFRSSHAGDDGSGSDDYTIPYYGFDERMNDTGEIYIEWWVKYESDYTNSSQNVKWAWTGQSASYSHLEIIWRGGSSWIWQLSGSGAGFDCGTDVSKNPSTHNITKGVWHHVEIYIKDTGTCATSQLTVWVDDVEKTYTNVDWGTIKDAGWISSPAINATSNQPEGEGWWQIDQFEVWDGLPGADTTSPTVTISTADPSNITSDSLSISGTASDANGISQCKYRIGAAPTETQGTVISGTTSWSGTATGFSQGANTLYVGCDDPSDNWGSDSITVNLDSIVPTLTSVTIASSGLSVVFEFSEAVTESGTGSDWTVFNLSGGAVALSSPNVVSDTITYTMGRKVYQGETLYELDYTQPGNGIEDIADNDLASINNFSGSFTNGSTQQPPEVSDISGLELQ
jgi:hypothetical protein